MIFFILGMLLFCDIMNEQIASQESCLRILMPEEVDIASFSVELSERDKMSASISA